MPERGRKPKISKEIIENVVNAVKAGCYMETAAAISGVHKDTLYDWFKKAEKRGGLYREFSDAVKKALAESEARDVIIIGEAAKSQWQAAAWRLERRFPDRWGRKDKVAVSRISDADLKEADDKIQEVLKREE